MRRTARNTICALAALFALGASGLLASAASDPPESPNVPVRGGVDQVGKPAPPLVLTDTEGKTHDLSKLRDKIVVLEWTSPHCPASLRVHISGVIDGLIEGVRKASSDVVYLQVCSTRVASTQQIEALRNSTRADVPLLLDADGSVARAFKVTATPHLFVIDGEGTLRFHGAVDNDPSGTQRERGQPVLVYALQAVLEIVAEKDVRVKYAKPYGSPVR